MSTSSSQSSSTPYCSQILIGTPYSSQPFGTQYTSFSQHSSCTPLSRSLSHSNDDIYNEENTCCSQKTEEKVKKIIKTKIEEKENEFEPRKKMRTALQENQEIIISDDTSFDPRKKIEIPNFKQLPKGKINRNYTIANKEENTRFNRYFDILPDDENIYAPTNYLLQNNKIKLLPYYLNASKIILDVEDKQLCYVATQAPLEEHTFNEFWKAIITGGSDTIVNLTMVMENNKRKGDDYWSDAYWAELEDNTFEIKNGKEPLGLIRKCEDDVIIATSHNSNERIVKRTFEFSPCAERSGRIITQYHYENWPDKGVPKDIKLLYKLLEQVDATCSKNGPPFIHCSAGCGRTGTLIAIMTLIEELKMQMYKGLSFKVDPVKTIECMRNYRNGMIQSQDQLDFIYHAIFQFGERLEKCHAEIKKIMEIKV